MWCDPPTEKGEGTPKIEYQTNRGYQEAWPSYTVRSKQNGLRFNTFAFPAFFLHYLLFSLFASYLYFLCVDLFPQIAILSYSTSVVFIFL
jgi:hypothetical protein